MDGAVGKALGVPTLTIIGCVQADVVMSPVTDLPTPGGTLLTEQMAVRVGGAGANAALASVEAGLDVRLIGCIGEDQLGGWMRDQLTRAGLADELVVAAGEPSGLTVVLESPGRDRTFLTYLGVNALWEPAMIPDDALTCDNLLLCDYFVAPRLRGEAARAAAGHGTRSWRSHVLRHHLGSRRLLRGDPRRGERVAPVRGCVPAQRGRSVRTRGSARGSERERRAPCRSSRVGGSSSSADRPDASRSGRTGPRSRSRRRP